VTVRDSVRNAVSGSSIKLAFHDADTDTDTDILARILSDTSDTRDFLKLFLWQAERRHSRDDPREDVGEDDGVGVRVGVCVVECQLNQSVTVFQCTVCTVCCVMQDGGRWSQSRCLPDESDTASSCDRKVHVSV